MSRKRCIVGGYKTAEYRSGSNQCSIKMADSFLPFFRGMSREVTGRLIKRSREGAVRRKKNVYKWKGEKVIKLFTTRLYSGDDCQSTVDGNSINHQHGRAGKKWTLTSQSREREPLFIINKVRYNR